MRLPEPGQLFEGRYLIERELGAGGFSRVFLALEEHSRRPVALKVLLPGDDGRYSTATQARFSREVRVIANLRHPNTVTLYTHGTSTDGLLYMVFEHIPGEDLADAIARQGRFEPFVVETILRQALGALSEAHAAGLVHRDIKPENIRIDVDPSSGLSIKLLDFGIARSTDHGHPSITKTGELFGTPRYMSPEQLMDQPLTPASDLYSLGMVAFELLVGRSGLQGNSFGDQLQRLNTGYEFGAAELERVGPRLLGVIRRMTARDVRDRFSTAGAVVAALDSPAAPAPTATTVSEVSVVVKSARPNPSLAGIAIIVVLLTVAAFVVMLGLIAKQDQAVDVPAPAHRNVVLVKPTIGATTEVPAPQVVQSADIGVDGDDLDTLPGYASPGCGGSGPQEIDGVVVNTPKSYDGRNPHWALIWFGADAEAPMNVPNSVFRKLVEDRNLVVIIPTSVSLWTSAHLPLAEDILREVGREYCLDENHIFAASNGGGGRVTERLACAPWIAGVAINSQIEDEGRTLPCPDPRPAMWILPRNSVNQPLDGGSNCFGVPKRPFSETEEALRERYGCHGSRRTIHKEREGHCDSWKCEVPFEVCLVDGGQGWPEAPRTTASRFGQATGLCPEPAPPDFRATDRMWKFFEPLSSPERLSASGPD